MVSIVTVLSVRPWVNYRQRDLEAQVTVFTHPPDVKRGCPVIYRMSRIAIQDRNEIAAHYPTVRMGQAQPRVFEVLCTAGTGPTEEDGYDRSAANVNRQAWIW